MKSHGVIITADTHPASEGTILLLSSVAHTSVCQRRSAPMKHTKTPVRASCVRVCVCVCVCVVLSVFFYFPDDSRQIVERLLRPEPWNRIDIAESDRLKKISNNNNGPSIHFSHSSVLIRSSMNLNAHLI